MQWTDVKLDDGEGHILKVIVDCDKIFLFEL
jgi:hypothetical protein